MHPNTPLIAAALLFSAGTVLPVSAEQWSGFRGTGNNQTSIKALPSQWNDDSVAWRAKLPGGGQSSPVIWNDRVFTTCAEGPNKESSHVVCYDLNRGTLLWDYEFKNSLPEEVTDYISRSAPTPIVDAHHVYALFEGGDIVALTHDGKPVWQRDLARDYGPFKGNHGQGASPALSSHGLVVLMDHQGPSTIVTLDVKTGETLWKTDRDTSTAWASPVIHQTPTGEEIVCSASSTVTAYDPAQGSIRWHYDTITGNNVPTATIAEGFIAVGSNRKNNTQILQLTEGKPQLVWKARDASSSFGSPLIYQGRVYVINKAGVLYCYGLESGELLYDHRLPSSTWASPLGASDRVWFFCKDGATVVLESADTPRVVSEASLTVDPKDRVYGYAVTENRFVFRIGNELISVAN